MIDVTFIHEKQGLLRGNKRGATTGFRLAIVAQGASMDLPCRMARRMSPSVNKPQRARPFVHRIKAPVPALSRNEIASAMEVVGEITTLSRRCWADASKAASTPRSRRRMKSLQYSRLVYDGQLIDVTPVH